MIGSIGCSSGNISLELFCVVLALGATLWLLARLGAITMPLLLVAVIAPERAGLSKPIRTKQYNWLQVAGGSKRGETLYFLSSELQQKAP